jgi:hypothetical protein
MGGGKECPFLIIPLGHFHFRRVLSVTAGHEFPWRANLDIPPYGNHSSNTTAACSDQVPRRNYDVVVWRPREQELGMLVYRYDDECYTPGQCIPTRGDSFNTLTEDQKVVELAVRLALPAGAQIRGESLYTWANEMLARRLWRFSKKKYLYELEIDERDIRHKGDLNWYSAAMDAVKAGRSPHDAVKKYCNGEESGPPYTEPRVELLVSQAKMIRKL